MRWISGATGRTLDDELGILRLRLTSPTNVKIGMTRAKKVRISVRVICSTMKLKLKMMIV